MGRVMEAVHQVDQKLINALRAEAYNLFPTLGQWQIEDVVQAAFIRTAAATWDWCPSKAYLKKAVRSAGIKLFEYKADHEIERYVDLAKIARWEPLEIDEEDPSTWQLDDLPATWDLVDIMEYLEREWLQSRSIFAEEPEPLTAFEQEVKSAMAYEIDQDAVEVAEGPDPFGMLEDADKEFVLDAFDGMSQRDLAEKYDMSQSTVHRRLKGLGTRWKDLTKVRPKRSSRPKKGYESHPVIGLEDHPIPA
jgi:DNA-directed RNA polymerase specialized sigma24 family protein